MLHALAVKHGTDKTAYARIYDAILRNRRESVKSLLEIGIGNPACMAHVPGYIPGASLRMWKEYFPNADILGLDINQHGDVDEWRICTAVANQNQPAQLREIAGGPHDVIIDDGSHAANHQISSCLALWDSLSENGVYIIEDVNQLNRVSWELQFLEPFIIGVEPHVQEVCARALVLFK